MALAHSPKHGFSSPGCERREVTICHCHQAADLRRIAPAAGREPILENERTEHLLLVRWSCLTWVLFFGLAAVNALAADIRFSASGISNYTNYTPTGAVLSQINAPFIVAVDGRRVFMRLQYANDHYAEWSFDGTYAYHLLESPDRLNPVSGLNAAAVIREDEFPTDAVCILRNLWLGLGSAGYLTSSNYPGLLVPWGAKGLFGMRSYLWNVERIAGSPHLPSKIIFTASEDLWNAEESTRIEKSDQGFSLRVGFVGGRFETLDTKPFNGLTIPVRFRLQRFRFDRDQSKPERLLESYLVTVTNLSAEVLTDFRPGIRRATDVSDMMEETAEKPLFGFVYTLTNSQWMARSDPRRKGFLQKAESDYARWLKMTKERAQQSSGYSSREKLPMRLIIFGVFLTTGILLWVLVTRSMSRNTKSQT
jgi:hypothetical protein